MKKVQLSGWIPQDIDKQMRIEAVHLGLRYPGEFIPWLWEQYKKYKSKEDENK